MGEQLVSSLSSVALAIVGLAIIAVLVSKNANTSGVIGAGASGFAGALSAATNPFSGGNSFGNGIGSYSF